MTGAVGPALAVIEETAAKNEAPCFVLNRDFAATEAVCSGKRQSFVFRDWLGCEPQRYSLGLLGRHQVDNAALALAACKLLQEPRLTPAVLGRGLEKALWPGRFEVINGSPEIVLDGAHNPDGIRSLRRTLDEVYPGRSIVFLFGVLADKQHGEMVRTLFRSCDRVVVVRPDSPRAANPALIAAEIQDYAATAEPASTIVGGLELAKSWAGPDGLVCAAGSLYMIGAVRRQIMLTEAKEQTDGTGR